MFNFRKNNWTSLILSALLLTSLSFTACSSDDEESDNCAPDFMSQTASGIFMGDSFTFVEGTAEEDFADNTQFRFNLYGEAVTGDACDGFNFEKPDSSIIFSVPMVEGIYDLGTLYSVTFNDASVVNEVNADLALCGAVEITAVSDTEVTGRIDASSGTSSTLNGTFTVARCQ